MSYRDALVDESFDFEQPEIVPEVSKHEAASAIRYALEKNDMLSHEIKWLEVAIKILEK